MTEATSWIDIVCAVVVVASVLLSMLRGLVQEVASLAVWILALVGASRLAIYGAEPLQEWLPPAMAMTVAFALIFVLILLLGRLLTLALKELVQAVGGGFLDRLMGVAFGLARGWVILTVLAVLAAMTPLIGQPAWQTADSRPVLEWSIRVAAPWLPDAVSSRVQLDSLKRP
ncbi:MAG: hypothetical protein RJA17_341 [Pseudomonadota bacterium]